MSNGRYYLELPIPGGNGQRTEYYEVDPSRLSLNTITKFFVLARDRGTAKHYLPAHGVETVVRTTFDPTEILTAYTAQREEIRDTLHAIGPEGERVASLFFSEEQLPDLMKSIAQTKPAEALAAVQTYMYTMMSALAQVAQELQAGSKQTSHLTQAVDSMVHLIGADGGLTANVYLAWAVAAEEINNAVDALQSDEATLRRSRSAIDRLRSEWDRTMNPDMPQHVRALAFFEGDASSAGFIAEALSYYDDPDLRPGMNNRLSEAESQIAVCEQLEAALLAAWHNAGQQFQQNPEMRQRIEDNLEKLARNTDEFLQQARTVGADSPRPYQIANAPIDSEHFLRAESITNDLQWGKQTARDRLLGFLNSLSDLRGREPRLPSALRSAITVAKEQIRRIREEWATNPPAVAASVASTTPPVEPHQSVTAAKPETEEEDEEIDSSEHAGSIEFSDARLQEIYELAICVGFYQTIRKKAFYSTTTPFAIMRILVLYGKITEAERGVYQSRIRQRIFDDSDVVETYNSAFTKAQRSSLKDWVRVQVNPGLKKGAKPRSKKTAVWLLKLSLNVVDLIPSLYEKHRLDGDAIGQASKAKRAEQTERCLGRKSPVQSP